MKNYRKCNEMKIAYIITAYTDAPQLRRLVDSLCLYNTNNVSDFYIHIDRKVKIDPFLEQLTGCNADIYWCKNQYRINWGGFNQVRSQFELLRMIFEETKRLYDRIVCLSGTDYPLWSNRRIVSEFENNPNKEYIGGFNITKSKDKAQISKIKNYHFFRDLALPLKLKRLICGSSKLLFNILPIHKPLSYVDSNGKVYDIYTGSDYWGLSYNCAKMAYETMKYNKKIMNYFKTSYIPSESVINTIVFNSSFYSNCSDKCNDQVYPGLEILTPLHLINYTGAIKVYSIDDWDELMHSDKMFFRKAKTVVSDELISKLEREIREKD